GSTLVTDEELPTTRGPIYLGVIAMILMSLTFGFWASTAPIAQAVIASGSVAAAGRNFHIQHLEGGLVEKLHVRDGDRIKGGEILVTLDDTQARTQLARLAKQWLSLRTQVQRYEAERDERTAFQPVKASLDLPISVDASEILDQEAKEFAVRLSRYQSEQAILVQRLKQLDETET